MLMVHVWLQQQKQIYRLRNVHAGYVLYRALVFISVCSFMLLYNIMYLATPVDSCLVIGCSLMINNELEQLSLGSINACSVCIITFHFNFCCHEMAIYTEWYKMEM